MKATDEATEPSARSTLDARRSAPSPSLIIGTHALVAAGFKAENLGLVIIDEQHKFGVTQREQLVRKGRYPHLLVMTATPIPRTFGLTLYGDLDVSVINELPPGRGRIKTFVRGADKLPQVWAFIRERLAEGRQAYVVYPRVEESGQNTPRASPGTINPLSLAGTAVKCPRPSPRRYCPSPPSKRPIDATGSSEFCSATKSRMPSPSKSAIAKALIGEICAIRGNGSKR